MNFVTSISLVVLGAMFLALLGWGSIRAAWRNCEGRRGVFAALAILAAICSIVAQKPSPDTPTITVDALLRDVGCYATNNVFHAAVTNAQSYAGVDFSDCDLMVYARERASSDAASWFELTPRKKFSQQPADYAIENATNFNYMVYLNYVPPSPVHTNGVFELYGFVIENETQGEPDQLAAGFINSRAFIAPPTARDYIQDGLIAMWDGIENAGWETHNPSATVWKDLIGNRDWTLGASTSYEWTANSFDAKDQFAATQDFIDGSIVKTVELCAKIKTPSTGVSGNHAFVIIGRISASGSPPYYGLLYRNSQGVLALMGGRSYFAGTASEFAGVAASFSFPNYATTSVSGYFNGTSRGTNGNNTLDYNSTTRGTVARIGGTAKQSMPIEVYNIRLYSRALTAEEIEHNYKIDKERFN